MKKSLFAAMAIFALFLSNQSFAQTFGIKGGLTASKFHFEWNDESVNVNTGMKYLPGFHIGPTMEINLNKRLVFETALLFNQKGYKQVIFDGLELQEDFGFSVSFKSRLYYLQIPLNLKATANIGALKVFASAGPYVSGGLFGYHKAEVSGPEEPFYEIDEGSNKVKWGEDALKRFDAGINAGIGLEFKAMQLGIAYDHGLSNLTNSESSITSNRSFRLSFGYRFSK